MTKKRITSMRQRVSTRAALTLPDAHLELGRWRAALDQAAADPELGRDMVYALELQVDLARQRVTICEANTHPLGDHGGIH